MRTLYSHDAEQAVLGGLLIDPERINDVLEVLTPDAMGVDIHKTILAAITNLHAQRLPVDVVTLSEFDNRLDLDYLIELAQSTPSSSNILTYAKAVNERFAERQLYDCACKIQGLVMDAELDTEERIAQAQALFTALSTEKEAVTRIEIRDSMREVLASVTRRFDGEEDDKQILSGYAAIDKRIKGFRGGNLIIVGARPGMGKAQPLTSKILLESGDWKDMGSLQVGDRLASADGARSQIEGVYPQGVRPIYQVILSDGRRVECDLEHLWAVTSCKFKGVLTLTTAELIEKISTERYTNRIRLVPHNGEFGKEEDLGIDPWLLGFLIGDGCLRKGSVRFSTSEQYILGRVRSSLSDGHIVKHVAKYDYSITKDNICNEVLRWMGENGLVGTCAADKRIPGQVFTAAKHVRQGVLAGLLESDGWVQNNSVQYSTASVGLAEDISSLARSLGGCASRRLKTDCKYSYRGEARTGQPAHILTIQLDGLSNLLRSPRLIKNISTRAKTCAPIIRGIEYVRDDEARCIKVSHPSSLYITDGYTVTHNTTYGMGLVKHAAQKYGKTLVFSLEMPHAELTQRLVSSCGQAELDLIRNPKSAGQEFWSKFTAGTVVVSSLPIVIDDKGGLSIIELTARARREHRKSPVRMIMVDYIQLMTSGRKSLGDNRNLEVGLISQGLKNLAKELDCPVIALSQLNRGLESRSDKRPMPADLRDSGSLEQDADIIQFLYRDEMYHDIGDNDQNKGVMEINTAKFRDGQTGVDRLEFKGATNTLLDKDFSKYAQQVASQPKKAKFSYGAGA